MEDTFPCSDMFTFSLKYDLIGHLQIVSSSALLQLSVQKLYTRLTALQDQILSFIVFKRNSSCRVKRLVKGFLKLELLKICLCTVVELYMVVPNNA